MYLILFPDKGMMSGQPDGSFNCIFSTDMHRVSKALENKDVQVYSLKGMTRIVKIEATYQEVTQEMIDG